MERLCQVVQELHDGKKNGTKYIRIDQGHNSTFRTFGQCVEIMRFPMKERKDPSWKRQTKGVVHDEKKIGRCETAWVFVVAFYERTNGSSGTSWIVEANSAHQGTNRRRCETFLQNMIASLSNPTHLQIILHSMCIEYHYDLSVHR